MDDLFCVLPFNKTLIRSPIRTLEAAHLLGTQMKKIQSKVHGSKHGSRDVLMIHFEKRSEVLLSRRDLRYTRQIILLLKGGSSSSLD